MNSPADSPGASASTVFIVDDDDSFSKSLARLLRAVGYSVRVFASAREFLDQLAADASGCVVADLQMPGLNGLEMQEALGRTANPLPVVFLTGQGDIPASVRAMRGGAVDFLTKLAPKEDLLNAVVRALQRDVLERAGRMRTRDLRARFAGLTEREREVLGEVVRGRLNKQIAHDLGIHLRTVKLHRTNLTRKLGVQSVAELTQLAGQAGVFPAADRESPASGFPPAPKGSG